MANVVLPIVRLFFPCEGAALDPIDEKWVIRYPMHTVEMPSILEGNLVLEGIKLYAQFTGGVGLFRLSVQLVDDMSETVLGKSPSPIPWIMAGGDDIHEEVFVMQPLKFPRPGVYQFRLIANHAALENGIASLRVLSER